jgi:hypothetical protein
MPSAREAWSLLVEGVGARARLAAADGPGRIWADGLQPGVLLLTFANLDVLLWLAWRYPAWTALLGATVVAILRARPRMALVLAAVAALAVPVLVVVVAQAAGSVGLASTSPRSWNVWGSSAGPWRDRHPRPDWWPRRWDSRWLPVTREPPSQRSCWWPPGWPGRWSSARG